MRIEPAPGVTYDAHIPALTITALTINHPAVTAEALRWTTGSRGPAAPADEAQGADLTAYAEQAIVVGAQAIAAAGGTQDTFKLEQLVQDVGRRTTESTAQAAEATHAVVADATKTLAAASADTTKALKEEGELARKAFGASVTAAQKELDERLGRLLAGEDAELVVRIKPLLESFGASLARRADEHTATLFDKATRALNPDDPTSPLAKHHAQLERQQAELAARLGKQHDELTHAVTELATAVKVQQAASEARAKLAKVTPLKGGAYEENIREVMSGVAAGLGDEYVETRHLAGAINRCKKGDGVLVVAGGQARLVLEMTDSERKDWGDYLDEAERNRQAVASLGLVPSIEQNAGQSIRVLGPRRIVMAFDPESSDPALLRTVVQLLHVSALAAVARQDTSGAQVATERIAEALEVLPKVERIRKAAGYIRKSAGDIDTEADRLQTSLNRLLLQAQTALAGTPLSAVDDSGESSTTGVA